WTTPAGRRARVSEEVPGAVFGGNSPSGCSWRADPAAPSTCAPDQELRQPNFGRRGCCWLDKAPERRWHLLQPPLGAVRGGDADRGVGGQRPERGPTVAVRGAMARASDAGDPNEPLVSRLSRADVRPRVGHARDGSGLGR